MFSFAGLPRSLADAYGHPGRFSSIPKVDVEAARRRDRERTAPAPSSPGTAAVATLAAHGIVGALPPAHRLHRPRSLKIRIFPAIQAANRIKTA